MMQGKLHKLDELKKLEEESKMSIDSQGNMSPVNFGGEMIRLPNVASLKATASEKEDTGMEDGYASPTSYLS
jgi:hypothetical protein